MSQPGPSATKLVCFDFDHTLVNAHFHTLLMNEVNSGIVPNTLEPGPQVLQQNGSFLHLAGGPEGGFSPKGLVSRQYGAPTEKIQDLIKQHGLKHPQEYAQAMMQAINNGHKVAITSFTLFPEVAVPTLRAIFATVTPPLTQQQVNYYVNKICVVGGFPSNGAADSNMPGFYGKEEHIQAAMRFFARQGVNINRANAVLVDDSTANINLARAKGPVVEVPADNTSAAYITQINQVTTVNVNRKPVAPSKPNAANKQSLPKVPPQMPPRKPNAAVVASRPIVNNQTVTKPTGAPPQPPQDVQPYKGQQPRQPSQAVPAPQSTQAPLTTQPLPPVVTFSNTAPRSYIAKLPPRIPDPLTPNVVAQHLPKNPKLDAILSPNLQNLEQNYQSHKKSVHADDKGLTNLFNKAKQAVNSIKGTQDKRLDQLASIVNVFSALKSDQQRDPAEKATLAYAHLENLKKESNSSGMRQVCLQLQSQIKTEFPNVVESGVRSEYKEEAKKLAANIQAPNSRNSNKPT